MTLSADDKKRIAEEEKERLKARSELQAEEKKKKRKMPKWVPIGCGSLILLIIIIYVIGTVTGSKNNTTTQTASATTAETSSTKITNPALAFQPIKYTSDENRPDNNGEAKLAPFSVPTQDWVIDWSYTPSGDGVFSFFVYPNYGADTNTAVATVLFPDTTSGSLTCSRGPGQYQIVMVTGCNWSITIHPQQ